MSRRISGRGAWNAANAKLANEPFSTEKIFPHFDKGQRVLVTGGAWAGFSGEYVGPEKTLVGELHRVDLDNGMGTLVSIYQIRKI